MEEVIKGLLFFREKLQNGIYSDKLQSIDKAINILNGLSYMEKDIEELPYNSRFENADYDDVYKMAIKDVLEIVGRYKKGDI